MNNKEWAVLKEKWPLWNNVQRRLFTYWFFYRKVKSEKQFVKDNFPQIQMSENTIFDLPFKEGLDKCVTDHDMQDLVSLLSYELKIRK